ncbi:MAG: RusA family crossover junction endodeoxyribonuclease [Paludibacteraceae bacterium]|nr:RusA family crossover junction endodeoxyribonuclease [Paludibacteraceae bacterium]
MKCTILGKIPSKSNCYKIIAIGGHSSLAKQKVLKEYERSFFMQCNLRGAHITSYFSIDVDVYYENLRPDLDNCFKILLDCLQQVKAISNDRQCVEIHARKLVDKLNPRIEFEITPICL